MTGDIGVDKFKFETPDMVAGNIDKIAELFPSAITEMRGEDGEIKRGVNFEVLKQLLSREVVDGDECYEFTWVGKKAAMAEAARPITKTLRPVKEDSRDWDTTENLYIEGDNLEVLKLLQESYLGKIKMIYIDPPYNTGNDFIYADDFMRSQEEENEQMGMYDEDENRLFKNTDTNGRFHSDWCSIIYSRLMLARNLLTDDGVIFISIDDSEQENLKKCCDEVFGQENFLSCVVIENDSRVRSYDSLAVTHEYLLIYRKNNYFQYNILSDSAKKFQYYDEKGGFDLYELRNRNSDFNKDNRPNLYYPFWVNPNKVYDNNLYEISLQEKDGWIKFYPQESQGIKTVWRWGKEKSAQNLNTVIFGRKATGGWQVVKKYRESSFALKSIWQGAEFLSDRGTLTFKKLFDNKRIFTFPKSIEMIKQCIKLSCQNDSLILDFFSGSATTAHAVMQLNAEDGGHRKFIMVQLPEKCDEASEAYKAGYKNICEIGKERIRRAGDKIKSEHPDAQLDIGFRVFRVDESNMEDVYYHPEELTQTMLGGMVSNIKPDRTDLDLLYACLLDWGVEINLPHTAETVDGCTVHNVDDGALVACFDRNVPDSVIRHMAAIQPLRAVFRDSSFASDDSKINVTEIFKNLSPDTKVKVI